MRWGWAVTWVAVLGGGPGVEAQSLSDVAAGLTSCSTAGGEGLSTQLVEVQRCLHPGQFVRIESPFVTATSPRVHLVAQASARDALLAAAAVVPLQINSGFRPVSDQYLLATSGACSVVAAPGSSNHQSGRAVDVQNTVEARTALTNAGCVWFGSSDAVHYDCPGADLRADSVRAFQRLHNLNVPAMPLDEDGVYGPMTAAALGAAPAGGFPLGDESTCVAGVDAGIGDAGIDVGLADAGLDATTDADTDGSARDAGADARIVDAGPDAGGSATDASASCGCRAAGGARSPSWLGLVFLAALGRHRGKTATRP